MLLRTEYREGDSWSTWLGFVHLVFENVLIFVFEGKLSRGTCIGEFDQLFPSVYAFIYACTYMRAIYVYVCMPAF